MEIVTSGRCCGVLALVISNPDARSEVDTYIQVVKGRNVISLQDRSTSAVN